MVQGWQVDLLHHRRGIGIPPAGPARPGDRGRRECSSGSIPWDIEEFDLSDDGTLIAAVVNEDGQRRAPCDLGRHRGRASPSVSFPPGQISGLKFRKGSHELGFTRSSAQAVGRRVLVRSRRGHEVPSSGASSQRWTESETGGLDTLTFAEPAAHPLPELRRPEDPRVRLPPAGRPFPGPRPVLIEIHGGPEGQFRPGFLGRLNYLINELGTRADHAQCPRLVGLRQVLSQARQRHAPRGRRQGHRQPFSTGSPSRPTSTRTRSA